MQAFLGEKNQEHWSKLKVIDFAYQEPKRKYKAGETEYFSPQHLVSSLQDTFKSLKQGHPTFSKRAVTPLT